MRNYSSILVVVGSLCLLTTLALAWCVVGVRTAAFMKSPSPFVVFAMCAGSLLNPAGFLALAIRPDLRQNPTSPFGVVMAGSFTLTTIGYGGAAWSVGQAALRTL